MAINDLHQIYPNRNSELRSVAKQCYEFGQTIAREPSAAHTNGLDEHAIERQRQYIAHARDMIRTPRRCQSTSRWNISISSKI
jgi:hypothetical protein